LAACIFDFQNCWSPYLALANGRGGNLNKEEKQKTNQHALMNGPVFFFLRGQGGEGFFSPLFPMCSYHVLKGFPSSPCVPIKFPNSSQMRSSGCSQ
jgi:hypothetical protein